MTDEQTRDDVVGCPVGRFFSGLDRMFGKGSEFQSHMNRSRIEFLKAVRSIVDQGIEHLEEKDAGDADQKITRIDVE